LIYRTLRQALRSIKSTATQKNRLSDNRKKTELIQ
jgi:hypothetical protein